MSQFFKKAFASVSRITSPSLRPPLASPPLLSPFLKRNEPTVGPASLFLKSGHVFHGKSFGAPLTKPICGEVVFSTALVGYPESMTDPSYHGQILVLTQPLIGNYGVPGPSRDSFGLLKHFESEAIQVKGLVIADYALKYSHWNAVESLGHWCSRYDIPILSGVDTRAIVTLLRESGSTLGQICDGKMQEFQDPNTDNLVAKVSTKVKTVFNQGGRLKIALIDCGVKHNIIRCLVQRGAEVTVVPWNYPIHQDDSFDGVFISNGPGDPTKASTTIQNLAALIKSLSEAPVPIPIFGICMGHQLLGLAAGFSSYKLPYGNRGHNQPAINVATGACVITSQNHGFALKDGLDQLPQGWNVYFRNANDGSNEGIVHSSLPFSSVQFHPEAKGGPLDTDYLFDEFLATVEAYQSLRNKSVVGPFANWMSLHQVSISSRATL